MKEREFICLMCGCMNVKVRYISRPDQTGYLRCKCNRCEYMFDKTIGLVEIYDEGSGTCQSPK